LAVYGIHDVLNMLKSGIVDTLIITDEIPYMHLQIKCNKCGNTEEKYIDRLNLISLKQEEVSKACSKCGSQDREILEQDIVDQLEELSANIGTKLEVISSKTEEGAQLGSLGNIGAILRFKPSH
jgi:peptide chain release factor subunit 1